MLEFSVTFFITLVNIGVLYAVLRALLFKPLTRFIENRTLKIRSDLENADREKSRAEELRVQYEGSLSRAESEAERILKEARDLARDQSEAALDKARSDADALIRSARAQIEAERRKEVSRMKDEVADLVVLAAGRLIDRELRPEDTRGAAARILADLERS